MDFEDNPFVWGIGYFILVVSLAFITHKCVDKDTTHTEPPAPMTGDYPHLTYP